jgi:hypothetical protein
VSLGSGNRSLFSEDWVQRTDGLTIDGPLLGETDSSELRRDGSGYGSVDDSMVGHSSSL